MSEDREIEPGSAMAHATELESTIEELKERLDRRFEQLEKVRDYFGIGQVEWYQFMLGGCVRLHKSPLDKLAKARALNVRLGRRVAELLRELKAARIALAEAESSAVSHDDRAGMEMLPGLVHLSEDVGESDDARPY